MCSEQWRRAEVERLQTAMGHPIPPGRQNRIEALRAASRIVASIWEPRDNYDMTIVAEWTLALAEPIAKWLEGER